MSREDVKSYVHHRLGHRVSDVTIQDGVAISESIHKGLIRTTEVYITSTSEFKASEQYQVHMSHIAHFIEEELTQKSVSHTTYKIHFV